MKICYENSRRCQKSTVRGTLQSSVWYTSTIASKMSKNIPQNLIKDYFHKFKYFVARKIFFLVNGMSTGCFQVYRTFEDCSRSSLSTFSSKSRMSTLDQYKLWQLIVLSVICPEEMSQGFKQFVVATRTHRFRCTTAKIVTYVTHSRL